MGLATSLGYFAANPFVWIPSLLITIALVFLVRALVKNWIGVRRRVKSVWSYLTFGYLHRKWRRLIWTPVLLVSTPLVAFGGDEEPVITGLCIVATTIVASFVTEPFVSKRVE